MRKERVNKKPSVELLEMIEMANRVRFNENTNSLAWHKFIDANFFYPELLDVLVEMSELYRTNLEARVKLNASSEERLDLPDFEIPTLFALDSNLMPVDTKELKKRFLDIAGHFLKITFDESHQIQFGWTGLGESLLGYDIRRFKKCPICQKFFWAKRLDKQSCSRECANIQNQRVYQSDEKKRDKHNAKRRATYESKQQQKRGQIRRVKNGTL